MIPPFAEFERYDPSMDLVLSCSGGKDSVAIGIALKERGIPFTPVFADVGWDHAVTYRYIREDLPELFGREVVEVRTDIPLEGDLEVVARMFETRLGFYSPMVRRILKYAMFSAGQMKWCTKELKMYPLAEFCNTLDGQPVIVTGIRAEESRSRSTFTAWEDQVVDITPPGLSRITSHQLNWRPGLNWTYDDVIGVFQHIGRPPNPLYLHGANRVGCWPCFNMNRDNIRVFAMDDARVSILHDLEVIVQDMTRDRESALKHGPPAFFQARTVEAGGKASDVQKCWPIKRVVRWARSKPRSPNQPELFYTPTDGCARWGLCPVEGPPPLVKS